jgi:hypothetical protein
MFHLHIRGTFALSPQTRVVTHCQSSHRQHFSSCIIPSTGIGTNEPAENSKGSIQNKTRPSRIFKIQQQQLAHCVFILEASQYYQAMRVLQSTTALPMFVSIIFLLLVLLAAPLSLVHATSPVVGSTAYEADVDAATGDARVLLVDAAIVERLIEDSGADSFRISDQVATNIAKVIASARNDAETRLLVLRMKSGEMRSDFADFASDLTPDAIVSGLAATLSEMEMAEILFVDPNRAFVEMERDGMIPNEHIELYRANPELLATDTRKRLYFTFLSLAAAGGYL